MARARKKDREAAQADQADQTATPSAAPLDLRHNGPWDSTERTPKDDETYLDLGPLLVLGREGFTFQLPAEGENGEIGSVLLMTEDSALELRVFAATRSGGLWDEVRADLIEEVTRLGGESTVGDGPWGAELHIAVPATSPEGEEGLQPSRIIGIEGPRWFLRATVLGAAALDLTGTGLLMSALRDVIVVRGAEPRIPREALMLRLPDNAIFEPGED